MYRRRKGDQPNEVDERVEKAVEHIKRAGKDGISLFSLVVRLGFAPYTEKNGRKKRSTRLMVLKEELDKRRDVTCKVFGRGNDRIPYYYYLTEID